MKRALVVLALAAIAVLPRAAHADDDPDRRAFSAGLACFDDKRYPCAIEAWEGLVERVGTARAWKVLYNLGIAHDALGDATRALERWEAFLEAAPPGEAVEQRTDAERRIAGLRARFAEIVVPPRSTAGSTARIGAGRDRAAGFRVLVAPGQHVIALTEPGRRPTSVVVDVAAGERREVAWPEPPVEAPAPLPPPPAHPPATPVAAEDSSAVPTGLAIAFGVATAASFALPIGLGVSASATKDDAARARNLDEYERAVGEFEDDRTLYAVSYVVPAVLGAATIGFVIWALAADDANARTALTAGPRPFGARF